jgi:hypothetical protein
MKKIWFWMVLLLLAFAACKKYESPSSGDGTPLPHHIDRVYHIGDYFNNDTLEGIVFLTYSGGLDGLMVSLDETQLPWCEANYVNSLTGATNPYDGWRNTNILMANYDLRHYPAIQWSHQRNTWHLVHQNYLITTMQWFVPSSSELQYLLQNQEAVNHTLDSLGYPTLEGKTYWSSTELGTRSAAALRTQDSSVIVSESVKDQAFYVRAIRNF